MTTSVLRPTSKDRIEQALRALPRPGSLVARSMGCRCPGLDNEFGRIGDDPQDWTMSTDCTLHWPLAEKWAEV
jgi:hypothetical protein